MREVRLHRELYRADSVDEATRIFERYARLERADDDAYFVVQIAHGQGARERRIADELANFALGLTIKRRGST
jgi:hypothetical protein